MEEQKKYVITIIAEGTVVDEKGEPLHGVTVSASRNVLGEEGELSYETKNVRFAEEMIDGEFKFKAEESSRITLHFEKEGYHSQRNKSVRPKDLQEARRTGLYHEKDIRVVMQAILDPDELIDYSASLHFHADGSGEGINFGFDEEPRLRPRPYSFTVELEDVQNLDKVAEAIPHGFSFVAATTPGGRIEILNDNPQRPSEITLRMHDPEGGFLPNESTEHIQEGRLIFRSMREAPEDGYNREWTLDKETLHHRYHYFFFKSKGFYGKGRIAFSGLSVPNDRSFIGIGSHFMLQREEGMRSVVTEK